MRTCRGRVASLLVVGALINGGCSSDDSSDQSNSIASPVATAVTAESADSVPDIGLPDTPAGRQLSWVLARGATATINDVIAHFDPSFLTAVPASDVLPILQSMGMITLVSVGPTNNTGLTAVLRSSDGALLQATIAVRADSPNLVTGLTLAPVELPVAPTTWAEVDTRLDRLAATTSMLAAEVADDTSFVVAHERATDQPGAIGSAVDLYVLGMLSDRIASGDLAWDDELTITSSNRSVPSGHLQDRPDGSTVTIREAAELMMSISDDTATDLLIDAVGRDLVEQALAPMGMGEASQTLTLPLLKTREFFILTWASNQAERDAYIAAGADKRRQILASLPADLPSTALVDPTRPTAIDGIEWFASASEMARAQLWVDSQRGLPGQEPLEQILGANPGIDLDPAEWTTATFKGGSEPGVVAMSWLLTRFDGRRFVVSIIANDATSPVDERDATAIATGIIDLLATT
ncbi:MAG: serine hydrolase [Ilumatobacteraceae bacterium]